MKYLILSLVMAIATTSFADPRGFSSAKKKLRTDVYYDSVKTFYCGCAYEFVDADNDGKKDENEIYPETCGYKPRNALTRSGDVNRRAHRIEWEHVVPAHQLGGHRACWVSENGRTARVNCRRTDDAFKFAEGDMHNLVPAVGELNADRSNLLFGFVDGEPRRYGECNFEVDTGSRLVEPDDMSKGAIARVYLYMEQKHGAMLSDREQKLFQHWNVMFPVTSRECEIDKRIAAVQGNHNEFAANQCQ